MPYRLPHPDNTVTQEELQKVWGFKCDCPLCRAEAATPTKDKKERAELCSKAMDFTTKNKAKEEVKFDKRTIEQATRMYERLEKTYGSKKFDSMPRPGLVALGAWLCRAYNNANDHDKGIAVSIRLLRDLGFVVQPNIDSITVDRQHCLLETRAVEAAVYAAQAYKSAGNSKASEHLIALAKEFYEMLNGEMRGFDDRYTI